MHKFILRFTPVLFALAVSLIGSSALATNGSCVADGNSCTNSFSPVTTGNTYFFGDGSQLTIQFDVVLTSFNLTVSVSNPQNPLPLDLKEFPSGTLCVQYPSNAPNFCDQYDITGSVANPPNGVPVRNANYKGLITLTLSYFTSQTVHTPAFGHAPGEITTFTEDILTGYSTVGPPGDPTMSGKTPSLSSVVALDEQPAQSGLICFVSPAPPPAPTQSYSSVPEIEVTFRLYAGGTCAAPSGPPLRDKTARFSLSYVDSSQNVIIFPALRDKEEGNKFHWDNTSGLNEFDFGTLGLPTGGQRYTITVISNNASPTSVDIILN